MRKYIFLLGHCRGLDLSMFSLEHPELLLQERCDLRRENRRGGTKQILSNSCFSWDSLEKGWLCIHEQNSTKNLVYTRGMHQVYYNRKQIGNPQPQLQKIHLAGPRQDLRAGNILCFLFCIAWYSTPYSLLRFPVGWGSLWKCCALLASNCRAVFMGIENLLKCTV